MLPFLLNPLQRATDLSFIDFCTLVGLASSAISSFLAWTYIKAGRKLGQLRVRRWVRR